jgi:hypothetical protein
METKICKKCGIEKEYCEFNKDKYSKDGFRYRCRQCTKSEYKNFYYSNLEREIERQVSYQRNNKETINKKRNDRHRNRYKNDILYKLKITLRNRMKNYLNQKNIDLEIDRTYKVIGCTPKELKLHLEKQFEEDMSWENYGHTGWHIDHIIPLFLAETKEDVFRLSHYSNLQPLWCDENYKKGKKIL